MTAKLTWLVTLDITSNDFIFIILSIILGWIYTKSPDAQLGFVANAYIFVAYLCLPMTSSKSHTYLIAAFAPAYTLRRRDLALNQEKEIAGTELQK